MPPQRTLKNYSEQSMIAAIEDVNRGMAYKAAARKHSVPRVTLMDKHKGKTALNAKMGPASVFTPEQEIRLVDWVKCMAKAGFPVSRETFLANVGKLAKELKVKFGNNDTPGRKWLSLFLNRHPDLSLRVSQNLTLMRRTVSQENIKSWFEEVETYLNKESLTDILNNPARVFNTDETAFFLNPKPGKVLAEKGCKTVYTASGNDEKFNLTVLLTANASGQIAPPMVVYRYCRIPQIIAESFPSEWAIGRSENGWMTHELFFEYIANVFLPWVKAQNITLPIIFFMDGHTSHISMPLSIFCKEQGIELVALYPNATHILQPMDVSVFHSLKVVWRQKVQEWRMENHGEQLRKHDFAPLLKVTLNTLSVTVIQNGFKKCGLVPWNMNAVQINNATVASKQENKRIVDEEWKFLNILEQKIGQEKILHFCQNQDNFHGPEKDYSLFHLWKTVKESLKGTEGDSPSGNLNQLQEQETNENEIGETAVDNPNNEEQEQFEQENYQPAIEVSNDPVPSTSISPVHNSPNKVLSEILPPSQLPSPFKRALLWPAPKEVASKRRKEKIPAVVTSPQMLDYYRKKEKQKECTERLKQERKEAREIKKQKTEANKKQKEKKKNEALASDSDSDSDTQMSFQESDASDFWNENSDEEEEEVLGVKKIRDLKEGDFILVDFKGGKRLMSNFIYLCVIQKILSSEEIEVMGLQSTDITKKLFVAKENDISLITFEQIKGKIKPPNVVVTGERVYYQCSRYLGVKEM